MGYNLTENLFGYTLVQDILVESATTSVTFSGLNYTAADDLLLVSDIYNPTASGSVTYLFVNGNTTTTNYYTQILDSDGVGVSVVRPNYTSMVYSDANNRSFSVTKIKNTNNSYFVYQSDANRKYGTSSTFMSSNYVTSTFTVASITSLTVTAQTANAIGIGSRFRLYKLNATKVADITVGTATTSVDITGLNITKDSEYMLVSDVSSNLSVASYIKLYANNNTTDSNYYMQYLYADSTSVISDRINFSSFMRTGINNSKSFSIANIKITNNGNFVWQSNGSRYYGNSSQDLLNINGTSTFTLSAISSLTISSVNTNQIGIGSRFQLYRMKG